MKTIPPMSRDLIAALDKELPHRCIRADESLADANRYAGRRDLIDTLIVLLQRSDKDKVLE